MTHPFRFGVQLSSLPQGEWRERLHRIESLGFASAFFPDHFGPQWEPVTALAAAAGATDGESAEETSRMPSAEPPAG